MFKARVLLAGVTLAAASAAHAGLTVTPTVTSDYDFRGITQNANDPALQVGVDYTTGPVHLGLWTSNVNFDSSQKNNKLFGAKHTEIDFIADYSGGDDKTVKYNFGFIDYTYPGQSFDDYPEIWGTLSKGWFSSSLHYSWDFAGIGAGSQAFAIEANATIPLGASGVSFIAHAEHNWFDYWDNFATGAYQDYAIGVSKPFGNFTVALKYTDTSGYFDKAGGKKKPSLGSPNPDVFSGKGTVQVSVSTTLPWAKP